MMSQAIKKGELFKLKSLLQINIKMDKGHYENDDECLRRQKSHDVEIAVSRKRSSLKRLCCAADKGSWSCRKLEDYASFWRKEGSGEKEELSMKQLVFLQTKMMNFFAFFIRDKKN